jgi:hypothetical protein
VKDRKQNPLFYFRLSAVRAGRLPGLTLSRRLMSAGLDPGHADLLVGQNDELRSQVPACLSAQPTAA